MPDAVKTLGFAYGAAIAATAAASVAAFVKARRKIGTTAPWLEGAPADLHAVGSLCVQQRRGGLEILA